ncbi:hypothetical protein IAT38_001474 [Cryptococcus sp. DSM 104549]
MPRKGGSRGLSLFTSLPNELRQRIRAVSIDPSLMAPASAAGDDILDDTGAGGLLRTQPDSDDEADEAPTDAAEAGGETEVGGEDVEMGEQEEKVEQREVSMIDRAVDVARAHLPTHPLSPITTAPPPNPTSSPEAAAGPSTLANTRRRSSNFEQDWRERANNPVPKKRKNQKGKWVAARYKEKPRVKNPHAGHPWDCTGLVPRYEHWTDVPEELMKYYHQRHLLFRDYDTLPVLLDHTGWFSITPHAMAAHIAERCACDVIVDAFCGVGGNAIEFAKTCERVIAIDNDLTRLKLARHNALHHGVADRIEFILGDFTDFARSYAERNPGETIDVVFLSPPWGGINYLDTPSPTFPLSAILPIHGRDLFHLTSQLTPNIAYYLPRNTDMVEIAELAKELDYPDPDGRGRRREWVEVEEERSRGKVKALTAYFGGLVAEE